MPFPRIAEDGRPMNEHPPQNVGLAAGAHVVTTDETTIGMAGDVPGARTVLVPAIPS